MFKRNRVTVEDAVQAIKAYQNITIRFVDVELEEAVRLASRLNIYAYDAYLIRCALKYKSPLLSLDQRLLNFARSVNTQIVEVTP